MRDAVDRKIINELQGGFPISPRPFRDVGERLGVEEDELIERLGRLLEQGQLSRFGPMFNAERLGGAFCLCAMAVPEAELDAIAAKVNAFVEVAHNYERRHALNMWFVLAVERPERIGEVIREIEAATGLPVLPLPKLDEYFVGLRIEA